MADFWAGGERLAVNVAVHLEEGAQLSPAFGDRHQEPENEASYAVASGRTEIVADSFYEYGARRGIFRILDLMAARNLPFTLFAAGRALVTNPQAVTMLNGLRPDVVGEGMRWVSGNSQSRTALAEDIRATAAVVRDCLDAPVLGWRARSPAGPQVREVVAQQGLVYDSMSAAHEAPYFTQVLDRPFLVIPISPDLDDLRFWQNRMFTAADFSRYVLASLERVRHEAGPARLLTVHVHPRIIGRPGRIAALERITDWLATAEDVRVLRRSEAMAHWLREAPAEVWNWPGSAAPTPGEQGQGRTV
jgi:allantoinase